MTKHVRFSQLYLGTGRHEDQRLPMLSFAFNGKGFASWLDAVTHFRNCLVQIVKKKLDNKDGCFECAKQMASHPVLFCSHCGRKLLDESELDLNTETSSLFQSWFDTEMHEFREWDELEQLGWLTSAEVSGGFVRIIGFDRHLADWDEEGGPFEFDSDLISTGEKKFFKSS
jgi:hypothetical protein